MVDNVLMQAGVVVVRLQHKVGPSSVFLPQRNAHVGWECLSGRTHGLWYKDNNNVLNGGL